jgi:hypothetical protein
MVQAFLEGRLILSRLHFIWCWKNGPGSEIRNNPSSLVEKNGADSPVLIFYIEGNILSDLTDVSERLAQMIIVDTLY